MKTATAPLPPLRSVKVLDQLRERIRYLHYSLRTEQAYVHWVRAFIRFHGVRHQRQPWAAAKSRHFCPGWRTSARFRSPRIVRHWRPCCSSTARCCAPDLPWLQEIGRPRPSRRLPVVLTPDEVVRILGFLEGEHRLFAQLLYGTGMRISEGLQLRVKDLDFDHGTIIVREAGLQGSGLDVTRGLAPSLREQLSRCTGMVAEGPGRGPQRRCAPTPFERKYPRRAFPGRGSGFCAAFTHSTDPRAVSCVAITCMTRPFSAPSNVP